MSEREMEELDSDEWLIGLASWVIQDGNYTDFGVGKRRRFAVAFFDDDLQPGAPGPKQARAVRSSRAQPRRFGSPVRG